MERLTDVSNLRRWNWLEKGRGNSKVLWPNSFSIDTVFDFE
jgi:hypothetical protein